MEFSIWQTEMSQPSSSNKISNQTQSRESTQKRKYPPAIGPPHVRFRVLTICETADARSKEFGGYIVARCAILSSRSRPSESKASLSSDDGSTEHETVIHPKVGDEGFVLFSLPSYKTGVGGSKNAGVCSRDGLVVGAEVHVWEPWHDVNMSMAAPQGDSGGRRRVLLCTRFATI